MIGLALEQLGRRREAVNGFRALIAADADVPDERTLDAAFGYVTAGRPASALRLLPRVHFGSGLSRTWTALDPRLDPVRNDPRFARWTTLAD